MLRRLHRFLAGLRGMSRSPPRRALDRLLDAGRMDAAVLDQGLRAPAGDLAAHRIKGGEQHQLRRFVDQQRDPGGGLEGLDVAALPADDPALHFLARQLEKRRGQVVVRLGRDPLHGRDQDALAGALQLLLGFLHRLAPQRPELVLALQQHLLAQLALDLLRIHLRDALQALADVLGQGPDGVAGLLDRGPLAVEPVLALLQLVVEQGEGLLVGPNLAQADVGFDLPAVESRFNSARRSAISNSAFCFISSAATAASRRATSANSFACSRAMRRDCRARAQTRKKPTPRPERIGTRNEAEIDQSIAPLGAVALSAIKRAAKAAARASVKAKGR